MSNPSQPTPPPTGHGRPVVTDSGSTIEPPFEERLRVFWETYRGTIVAVVVVVLLGIVGRSGWEWYQQRRASALAAEFGAAENADQLKAFASAHEGSALAGVAQLRVADEAYGAGRFAEAADAYDAALDALGEHVLAGRARIGAAVSRLKAGQDDAGKSALESVANDVSLPKPVRAEAAYHLASAAAGAGRHDEVNRLIEQINAVDPTSLWAQRAMTLRQGPESATPASEPAPAEEPAVTFPAPTP